MVDSAKITSSNVAKQAFWNLYNLINNRTNVPNPNDTSGDTKFVYRRLPRLGREFAGFPFIVVSRTRPSKGKGVADLTKVFRSYDFTVTVYSQDKSSDASGDPQGADQADLITDSIIETLDSPTNRKTFIDYGMAHLEYDIDSDYDDVDGRSVFMSEFDIRFENNLTSTS